MNVAIRFFSKSGNTKKLADAIAQVTGCAAKSIRDPLEGSTDILFLGGAIYAGHMDKELQKFIGNLTADKVKKIVVFGTAAGPKSIQPQVSALLEGKDITVSDEYFQCRGKFLLANKHKPDSEDLSNVRVFAKKVLK